MTTNRFRRVCEAKTRAADAREVKAREKAKSEPGFLEPVPPILVVLRKDFHSIPAGIVIEFESEALALHLVRLGLAVAVPKADFALTPSVVISGELDEFYERAEVACTS